MSLNLDTGKKPYTAPSPDAAVFRGYSSRQMHTAFELVQNKTHWKDRINTTLRGPVTAEERELITAAVIFFTGSVPRFEDRAAGVRVLAPGYWVAIGA